MSNERPTPDLHDNETDKTNMNENQPSALILRDLEEPVELCIEHESDGSFTLMYRVRDDISGMLTLTPAAARVLVAYLSQALEGEA